MRAVLSGASVYSGGKFTVRDVFVSGGRVFYNSSHFSDMSELLKFKLNNCFIFPGLTDVHVHLREPGFFYKETISTGTRAAARGGFTTVCAMPNLDPVPDSRENLDKELEAIRRSAVIHVLPYGAVTKGEKGSELSDMEAMAGDVVAFSDDGHGVQSDEIMESAMRKAKKLGKIIAAHCEDNGLLRGGYIHDGEYARVHGHRGICSESEWRQIERDLRLVRKTNCAYHVCHISAKESVELIRQAKRDGLDVTCETAPHYLLLSDGDIKEDGRFKMNPPLRAESDRQALLEGICDGTIDMVATDHAPHSAEEKSRGLEKSLMGVVGLETSFPALYTGLVKTGIITLEKLMELMHDNPAERFGTGSSLEEGESADLTVFDTGASFKVDPSEFMTKGRSTPFEGMTVYGKCLMTMCSGKIVWREEDV